MHQSKRRPVQKFLWSQKVSEILRKIWLTQSSDKRKVKIKANWWPKSQEKHQKKVSVSTDNTSDDHGRSTSRWTTAEPLPPNFTMPESTFVEVTGYRNFVFTPAGGCFSGEFFSQEIGNFHGKTPWTEEIIEGDSEEELRRSHSVRRGNY